MSDTGAKQQIIDKIKNSTNILVTVSSNPSVDELSAALGLSLLLNKMKKHATAVFSGEIPPAINFLDPEKTFENSVDSLRDFIIALDKEKADHLRYKVEGDVVKIFITPYKTTITSEDLDFSQGDYNVELVLALGVKRQDNLDKALEAHGQIFDDATVATLVAGSDKSDLGSISWHDGSASSLSEMTVSISEALKADKPLIDEQIATAFLAGIVSATERFSNSRTSARVMTMAAQLMSAGANQQLIASKFEEAEPDEVEDPQPEVEVAPAETQDAAPDEQPTESQSADGMVNLSEGESTKVERDSEPEDEQAEPAPNSDAGTLSISHEMEGTLDEVAQQKAQDNQAEAAQAAEAAANMAQSASDVEQELADTLPPVVAQATPDVSPEDLRQDVEAVSAEVEAAAELPQLQGAVSSEVWQNTNMSEPAYGGTLNATADIAAEEARRLSESSPNKTILNHGGGYIADQTPTYDSPINAASQAPEEPAMVNPLAGGSNPTLLVPPVQPPSQPLMDVAQETDMSIDAGLPPLPDFSTLPPLPPPPIEMSGGAMPDQVLGDILPPAEQVPQPTTAADPGQFRIPGQN